MFNGLRGLIVRSSAVVYTVAELKTWLRVEHDQDDTIIAELEAAARHRVGVLSQRSLMPTQFSAEWDACCLCWNGRIQLPRPPLLEVVSIKAINADGLTTDLAGWRIDSLAEPGWVQLGPWESGGTSAGPWPAGTQQLRIDFSGGYESREVIPAQLLQAMRMLVGHWYEHREDSIVGTTVATTPHGVEVMCSQNRVTYTF